jgi:hypothetical protein
MPDDQLKARVAEAALDGAAAYIRERFGPTHTVEQVQTDRLLRQFRLRLREVPQVGGAPWPAGPRYFVVRVSEAI